MTADSSTGLQVRRAAHSRSMQRLARSGMVCRAVLYALIGMIAIQIPFGSGQEADESGAVRSIAAAPFGAGLLWLMVAGLTAMAVWQGLVAVVGWVDATERIEAGLRAGAYVVIAGSIVTTLLWGHIKSGDRQARDLTGMLLGLPAGQVLVGGIGIGVVVLGAFWIWFGLTRRFLKQLRVSLIGRRLRRLVETLGVVGNTTRGALAGLVGFFLVYAAVTYQPERAKGIDATLRTVAEHQTGPWLAVAAAVGLLGFAGYCLCEARWRRV